MKTLISLAIIIATLTSPLLASERIESWQSGESIKLVLRDNQGLFLSHGELFLESWNDGDDISEWVARRSDGTFVTGYKGKLEKFKVKGLKNEQTRLVIRNSLGHFVTWIAMDKYLTSGFERMDVDRDGKKDTVYVIRYNGKFVNWAKAELESWANYEHPVLVVRDTADEGNNGKILTYVAPSVDSLGRVYYKNPETGHFLSHNK